MFRLVLLSLIGVSINPNVKIVGGHNASIEDYPYMVSLLYAKNHRCGAAILNKNWVVTSARCTDDWTAASDLQVRAKSSTLEQGQIIDVEEYYRHPQYDFVTMDYDISVIKMASPIILGDDAQPIELAKSGSVTYPGSAATLTGWGSVQDGHFDLSMQLLYTVIPTISNRECARDYPDRVITDRMICAGYRKGGVGGCYSDIGGPLVIGNKLVGLYTWSEGCGRQNQPGIFSRIGALRDFIDETISE